MGRVAIIPSSVGYHWEELFDAYKEFKEAGWEINIFTVDGKPANPDEKSLEKNFVKSLIGLGVTDNFSPNTDLGKEITSRLKSDITPVQQMYVEGYDALYIPGGHGCLFDVNLNKTVHKKILEAYHKDLIISAVCHGTSAIALTEESGSSIVKGKRMTGFPEVLDDILIKLGWVNDRLTPIPYSNEEKMREAGANITWIDLFLSVINPWYYITDPPFITGVGPKSAEGVAKKVVKVITQREAVKEMVTA